MKPLLLIALALPLMMNVAQADSQGAGAKQVIEEMRGMSMLLRPTVRSDGSKDPVDEHKRAIIHQLYRMGTAAVPSLANTLSDPDAQMRTNAGLVLFWMSADFMPHSHPVDIRAAIPALLKATSDSDSDVRSWAAEDLGQAKPASPETISLLIKLLKDPDLKMRTACCLALREIGSPAKSALPALHESLNDSDSYVRISAGRAIRSIDR